MSYALQLSIFAAMNRRKRVYLNWTCVLNEVMDFQGSGTDRKFSTFISGNIQHSLL